jgi:uncharacterized protein RhaS with RHS repeats
VASSIGSLFSLSYTQSKVDALTAADGRQVSYAFHPLNGDLLSTVIYPDQRSRSYLYEPENAPLMTIPSEAALLAQLSTATGLPQSLYTGPSTLAAIAQRVTGRASRLPVTGIVDELGNRFATYAYDAQGRAILSEHAGVERYQFNYATAYTQTVVTDPFGTQRTYNFAKTAETLRQTAQSQPAGSGCGPSSSAITHDAQANVTSRTDFNNNKVCYAYDLSRNLETKRVEGVTSSAVCSTALSFPADRCPRDHHAMASRLAVRDTDCRTQEDHHHHLQRPGRYLRPEHCPGRRQAARSDLHPHRTSHHR